MEWSRKHRRLKLELSLKCKDRPQVSGAQTEEEVASFSGKSRAKASPGVDACEVLVNLNSKKLTVRPKTQVRRDRMLGDQRPNVLDREATQNKD